MLGLYIRTPLNATCRNMSGHSIRQARPLMDVVDKENPSTRFMVEHLCWKLVTLFSINSITRPSLLQPAAVQSRLGRHNDVYLIVYSKEEGELFNRRAHTEHPGKQIPLSF